MASLRFRCERQARWFFICIHEISSMSSRTSNTFMGKTALMSNLSCDSVIAGAFFPQPDSHVPEEEVSQHAGDHMVAPPRIFSYLVMVHPQVGFGLLEALFDSPANPREPDKGLQSGG